ncbi:hypothetical protein RRG08_025719 [Elysia crispata]|uniref:Uncharacterized protein n=1 Tax=Elysia crispata TaxID=231223 RepID=A0AAE1DZM3_9GAST|nr:hypothetical protein RRG08_025719 [Elysia crispata]
MTRAGYVHLTYSDSCLFYSSTSGMEGTLRVQRRHESKEAQLRPLLEWNIRKVLHEKDKTPRPEDSFRVFIFKWLKVKAMYGYGGIKDDMKENITFSSNHFFLPFKRQYGMNPSAYFPAAS